MYYSEIAVYTTSEQAELIAYFLQEVCMDGVGIYDKKDLYDSPSWDYKDDSAEQMYGSEVAVKGYCNVEDTERVLCFLRRRLQGLRNAGSLRVETRRVDGDAWVAKWKETFRPIETDKLVICPEWQTVSTDKKVFYMDSGVAFGTGSHETTSMCLQLAERLTLAGKSVLDVGCGSGILGLCALLLGAECALLVDLDSQATEVAQHNAEVNGLAKRAEVLTGNLTDGVSGKFDVVFANLTADVLAKLYAQLPAVVHDGTLLVISGILDVRLDGVLAQYTQRFRLLQTVAKGEWRAALLAAK